MNSIVKSTEFDQWLKNLNDPVGKGLVNAAVKKAEKGNFGIHKPVGGGVNEIVIDSGPGYRIYYTHTGGIVYFILLGGTKKRQQRDIDKAIGMAKAMKD